MASVSYHIPLPVSSFSSRKTIITARGSYTYRVSGRYIEAADGHQYAATSHSAARLACDVLAGEADASLIRATRWASSMIFFMFANQPTPPTTPAARMVAQPMTTVYAVAETSEVVIPIEASAPECSSWLNAHWNAPADAVATHKVGSLTLCDHCYAAHNKAMAHMAWLNEQAKAAKANTLTYVPFDEAA